LLPVHRQFHAGAAGVPDLEIDTVDLEYMVRESTVVGSGGTTAPNGVCLSARAWAAESRPKKLSRSENFGIV